MTNYGYFFLKPFDGPNAQPGLRTSGLEQERFQALRILPWSKHLLQSWHHTLGDI